MKSVLIDLSDTLRSFQLNKLFKNLKLSTERKLKLKNVAFCLAGKSSILFIGKRLGVQSDELGFF